MVCCCAVLLLLLSSPVVCILNITQLEIRSATASSEYHTGEYPVTHLYDGNVKTMFHSDASASSAWVKVYLMNKSYVQKVMILS